MAPLERAIERTPILAELGYDDKYSFNGLLQVTTEGNPSIGGASKARGLWYAAAMWVKDAPGVGKLHATGGVRADLTVLRLAQDHCRVIDGAEAGHRDLVWVRRMAQTGVRRSR